MPPCGEPGSPYNGYLEIAVSRDGFSGAAAPEFGRALPHPLAQKPFAGCKSGPEGLVFQKKMPGMQKRDFTS